MIVVIEPEWSGMSRLADLAASLVWWGGGGGGEVAITGRARLTTLILTGLLLI